jgi:hypothetical protein
MSSTAIAPRRIEIAAPDGPSAFALEQRLQHLKPVTVGVDWDWTVELEDDEDRLEEIEAAVRHWLRTEHLASTTMRVDAQRQTIDAAS